MSSREEGTPMKHHPKPASLVAETPITSPYPDRPSSVQAYYGGAAPAAFYASTVASPTPHPYMWGSQHYFMPPYGTPMPYSALFLPGGIFAHPTVPTDPNLAPTNGESGRIISDGKATFTKKSKRASGSTSSEYGGDSSSDANKENHESAAGKKRNIHRMLADGASAQNKKAMYSENSVVSIPATNRNIGMDYWNAPPVGTRSAEVHSNPSDASAPGEMVVHDGMMPDQWVHDERELRRQKRKQCNRESARRSRLRKQAECEELQERVDTLNNENHTFKKELRRLSEECEKVTSQNHSIKEDLLRICGTDDLTRLQIILQEAGVDF